MNAYQTARYQSYSLVLAHLKKNERITNTVPMFARVYSSAVAYMDAISATNKRKIENLKGEASHKQQYQDTLSALAQRIASIIGTYATIQKDPVLKEAMNFSKTELFYGPDQLLNEKSANILAKTKELATYLLPYGITNDLIDSFESRLKDYSEMINEPRSVAMERKQAIVQIKDHFKQLKMIFTDQLDPLMQLFETDHRDFYDQYILKRTIINPTSRKTRVEGTVTDKRTSIVLAGATVLVKDTEFTTSTPDDGSYSLRVPGIKQVPVTYQKDGYKPLTKQVIIKRGRPTILDIALEET